jgi:ATP-binding cassette subfamily B protein
MVESIGVLFVLWRGSNLVLAGQMTVGELISFETLVYFLLNPVKDMIRTFPQIQKSVITMDRINDVVESLQEDDLLPRTIGSGLDFKKISFSDVSFAHGFRYHIFNAITFNLSGQHNVTLIGESGGGKTSLVKLLVGFYQANSGYIKIDNVDINTINLPYLRKNIIYLSQSTFLFRGSIRENLLFDEAEHDLLASVYDGFELYDISKADISGVEYLIDENGSNLSGGQRQRLALARAILQKPQVLILDESLNQINQEMLMRILTYIRDNFSNILLIKISHHGNMIQENDRILRLEKGRMYENQQENTFIYST